MDDTYENIEEYNPDKERKILIVFDVMITDMFNADQQKINSIVT